MDMAKNDLSIERGMQIQKAESEPKNTVKVEVEIPLGYYQLLEALLAITDKSYDVKSNLEERIVDNIDSNLHNFFPYEVEEIIRKEYKMKERHFIEFEIDEEIEQGMKDLGIKNEQELAEWIKKTLSELKPKEVH
jgi:hypothetical protein